MQSSVESAGRCSAELKQTPKKSLCPKHRLAHYGGGVQTVHMIPEQAGKALRRHVLEPLLAHCVDKEHGGFLADFDDRWQSIGSHEKTLEHAARTTGALALLDQAMPGEGCDRLARHGCAFLQEVMWDGKYGGFFARVDRSGRPMWDGLKHPHAVTYAALAFQLTDGLLPPGEGESWARRALDWLDDVAWDHRHGGYWGSYRRDNARYAAGDRLPTPDGRDTLGLSPELKEINTQCDAIEMLAHCTERGFGSGRANRLEWMLGLVADRLIDPYGVMPYAYRRDWRPAPDLVRTGFQFQMARHLAMAPPSRHRDDELVARSCQLVDFCLSSARHPAGGFCFAVSADGRSWPATGPSSDLRQWWVQFEAVHALHILSRHESVDRETRAKYLRALEEQWSFVRNHFFDEQYGGVRELPLDTALRRQFGTLWRWIFRRPTSPVLLKSDPWKHPYHEVAALLALIFKPHEPLAR
jgi:mannose/cellobiose epimerase-like protein (N-acyl-D-glucosamine 2-epimerase family)